MPRPFRGSARLRPEEMTSFALRKIAQKTRQLSHDLNRHVRAGNVERVEAALKQMPLPKRASLVNQFDRNGLTALHYAAKQNRPDLMRLLINAHADVNRATNDIDRFVPFHYLCRWQHAQGDAQEEKAQKVTDAALIAESVKEFVEAGADCNTTDSDGMTGLHHASQRGLNLTVEELLRWDQCVEVDVLDRQEQTALHVAANRGDTAIVEMLLARGASPYRKDELGSLPIHLAMREGATAAAQAILRHAILQNRMHELTDAVDGEGSTILHQAVDHGRLETVIFALKNRADPNAAQANGDTALHLAAGKGHLDIIKYLIEEAPADAPIDINALDKIEDTPLHDAARLNRDRVVQYLIERGADMDAKNEDGITPLMKAAQWGQTKAVAMLLECGASISARDGEERTVFWHASKSNSIGVMQLIVQRRNYKTHISQLDQFGNSVLHLAARQGQLGMAELLLDYNVSLLLKNEEEKTPLHLAAESGNPGIVRLFCNRDADLIEDEDDLGNKPLHLAATRGQFAVVAVLLELGAAVESRNAKNWTPLDCAANEGWFNCCEVLLEHDAPVDAKDKRNRTPLHIAARRGHVKIVKFLLDHNADISHCDKSGRNCLDLAIEHGEEEVATTILKHDLWRNALRNVSRGKNDPRGNRYQNTPMLKLIRRMPAVAEMALTRCMYEAPNVGVESVDYQVTMDFEFIDFTQPPTKATEDSRESQAVTDVDDDDDEDEEDQGFRTESWSDWNPDASFNHPCTVMVDSNRESLLAHPVVTTLLNYKWKKFSRYFYYTNLLFYTIYLAFLTTFALITVPERLGYNDTGAGRVLVNTCATSEQNVLLLCRAVVLICCCIRALMEFGEMFTNGTGYLRAENVLDWTFLVTSVIFIWDWDRATQCVVTDWQWQVGAIAVWCAWLSFIAIQRRSAVLGIYVVMFGSVMTTFLKLLMVIVLFVIAFGLTFYMLLDSFTEVKAFSTPGRALLKTAVSMTGEFEFDTTFNNDNGNVPFPAVTYIIWVSFLIVMPIILMNMLVGLAVDDIKGVQENARLQQLSMQVRLILGIESRLPDFAVEFFGLNIPHYRVTPNERPSLHARIKTYLYEDRLTTERIQEAINPPRGELEKLEEQNKELRLQLKELGQLVLETHSELKETRKHVKAICRLQNIVPTPEDAI